MNKFVISLSTQLQRRSHIVKEFEKQQIQFEFFNAITPNECDQAASLVGLRNYSTNLHPNEVSCFLSHVMLWKKAVDENLDYIAIFEDDIYLGQNAKSFLMDFSWIPKQSEIVKLEAFYRNIYVSDSYANIMLKNERKLLILDKPHMGCGGYILSNKAARCLLDFIAQSDEIIPVDHIVFNKYVTASNSLIYQMYPGLCIQDGILHKGETKFPSSLEEVRNERKGQSKGKAQINFLNKLMRELSRFINQIRKIYSKTIKGTGTGKLMKMIFK